jgi:hypothetical protein
MEYKLDWYLPKRVLMLTISGDVSLKDLELFNGSVMNYLEEGIAPVHLVSIGHNIRRVPTNLIQIKQVVTYIQDPKIGWTIIVQEKPNPLTGFIASVATQAAGVKIRHVKSVVDGLEALKRLDQSLSFVVSQV